MFMTMAHRVILLDIDGVLVTTPGWRQPEIDNDGFLKFNERAARNLSKIILQTSADIILTTTHRNNYSVDRWRTILENRGIIVQDIKTIDQCGIYFAVGTRADEISKWIDDYGNDEQYVIIDDDNSLDSLPTKTKAHWVKTKPLIGLDDEATDKALQILNGLAA
jgi:HAD domain in Swiss Army Knife RNA repair proteins